ncbi:MAG: glucose-1-phosphate adenylyltransferase [Synergistaceae bacterium]|jgi:glucose-1-phosphate adenylyltransferase|nr:glucose-1-phosphate adenylyltransferase [Synergistaceae bacterium]
MEKRECIAMVLANGGTAPDSSTNCLAKPAMFYGGSHRIIDFTLNNCSQSGIDVVGILPLGSSGGLGSYIGSGRAWNASGGSGGVFMLPSEKNEEDYRNAADAVYRNIDFIEEFSPEYVCILSGDHIYKMDYAKMLDVHKKNSSDATIAAAPVFFSGDRRREIIDVDEKGRILDFEERPPKAGSDLASMGIYIFNWDVLRKYLIAGGKRGESPQDFGKDIVPAMLCAREKLYAYRFEGYWRDVGTVESLWESNMDLLRDPPKFTLEEEGKEVFTSFCSQLSYFTEETGTIDRSILSGLHVILGRVERSVLSDSVVVEEGAEVVDSVLMPNVYVGKNAKIRKAIVGPNVKIMNDVEIGTENGIADFVSDRLCANGVSLIAPGTYIAEKIKLQKNSYIENSVFAGEFDS